MHLEDSVVIMSDNRVNVASAGKMVVTVLIYAEDSGTVLLDCLFDGWMSDRQLAGHTAELYS